ncbi:hypothetical protein A6R68_11475, partial [Neotoma lepida]
MDILNCEEELEDMDILNCEEELEAVASQSPLEPALELLQRYLLAEKCYYTSTKISRMVRRDHRGCGAGDLKRVALRSGPEADESAQYLTSLGPRIQGPPSSVTCTRHGAGHGAGSSGAKLLKRMGCFRTAEQVILNMLDGTVIKVKVLMNLSTLNWLLLKRDLARGFLISCPRANAIIHASLLDVATDFRQEEFCYLDSTQRTLPGNDKLKTYTNLVSA